MTDNIFMAVLSKIKKISMKLDTISTDISTANSNASVAKTNTATNNTASSTGTLSQKLSYIISTLIGSANATGGSTTAGTVMAKLNAILTKVNSSGGVTSQTKAFTEFTIYTIYANASSKTVTITGSGRMNVVSCAASNIKVAIDGNASITLPKTVVGSSFYFESSIAVTNAGSGSDGVTFTVQK